MWNIYYRESTDYGSTWSNSVKLSTTSSYFGGFQSVDGFQFPYGDYGGISIDSDDNTHIVWGEGLGWYAGGTVFYATQNTGSGSSSSSPSSKPVLSDGGKIAITFVVTAILSVVLTLGILKYTGHIHIDKNLQKKYEYLSGERSVCPGCRVVCAGKAHVAIMSGCPFFARLPRRLP